MSTITIDVVVHDKAATAALKNMGDQMAKGQKRWATFGHVAGTAITKIAGGALKAGGAVVKFGADSVKSASDLNETINKSSTIFGKNQKVIEKFASSAAKDLGLSKQAAMEAAASFGDLFLQLGFTDDVATRMSLNVVRLSADLGSFNNLPTADVQERIAAAFRGEFDSLQALVPTINAATVQQRAMADTGKKNAEKLTQQEKAAATLAIVMDSTERATGDFAKTSDGLANQQKILAARFEDVKAKLGTALLPVVSDMANAVGDLFDEFEASGKIDDAAKALKDFTKNIDQQKLEDTADSIIIIADAVIEVTAALGKWDKVNGRAFTTFGVNIGLVNDAFTFWKANAIIAMDDVAKGMEKLHLLPKRVANMFHAMRKDAEADLNRLAANTRVQEAQKNIAAAVNKTRDALKANGKTIDENTQKGKNNRAALNDLAGAHRDYLGKLKATDAETKDVKKATESARDSFIRAARQMGASKKEAQALADKYGLVDRRINALNDKKITIKFGAGSYSIGGVKYSVNLTSPSSVGRSATGGMVRGAGTGTSDSIPMMLSNGEFVVNAKATAQHRELLQAINAPGKTPHAPATGMRAGGVVSFNNQGPGGAIYAPGQANKFANSIATAMGKDIGARVAKSIGATMGMGGPAGSAIASGGWASIYAILRRVGARRFTTYAGHDQGASRSRDITPPSNAIAETARRLSSIWYVIYNRRIASVTYGRRWRPYTRSNPHTDHVHVTLRSGVPADKGGMLPSGGSASNMSGNLERVLSPTQTRDFHNLVKVISSNRGGSVGNTYIVNAPNYVGDKKDLVKALTDLNRQGRLEVIRR